MKIVKINAAFNIRTCIHLFYLLVFINSSPVSAQDRDLFFEELLELP